MLKNGKRILSFEETMSAYVPTMKGYRPFYIQVASGDGKVCHDTTEWGLVAQTNPYPALPNPKEPYRNDWPGEDGDDEYTAQMRYEAFEMQVGFYVKCFGSGSQTAAEVLRTQLGSFFAAIRHGEFEVYDAYTNLGFRKARFAGCSDEQFLSRGGWARLTFTATFKVNDPVTRMKLTSSEGADGETSYQIVEAG